MGQFRSFLDDLKPFIDHLQYKLDGFESMNHQCLKLEERNKYN